MKDSDPSPCEKCTRDSCNYGGPGCEAWRVRYLHRQKQINAYGKRAFSAESGGGAEAATTHFVYPHPDDTRRYLSHSPCEGCKLNKICDTPCAAYLRWWDTRMKWFRREL